MCGSVSIDLYILPLGSDVLLTLNNCPFFYSDNNFIILIILNTFYVVSPILVASDFLVVASFVVVAIFSSSIR